MKNCLICSHQEFEFILSAKDNTTNYPDIFSIYKCKQCGLIQQINPYSFQKLSKFYPKSYLGNSVKNIYEITKGPQFLKSFFRYLYNNLKEILDPNKSILDELFKINPQKKFKNSLDIGCGSGKFLNLLKSKTNFDVYGFDMDNEAISYIKDNFQIPCEVSTIDEFKTSKKFDFISLNHFLEHDLNPSNSLVKVKDLISKDGILFIEVPNSNSLHFKVFGKYWLAVDLPRHISHFNSKNLENILNNSGFEIIKFRYILIESCFLNSFFNFLGIYKKITKLKGEYPIFSIFMFGIEIVVEKSLSLVLLPVTFFQMSHNVRVYAKLKN